MNKQILIVAGASVASLAAGGTGGYLYAKQQVTKALEERLELELESTKDFYVRKYKQALDDANRQIDTDQKTIQELKDALVDYEDSGDADISAEELQDPEDEEPPLSPKDAAALEEKRSRGKQALVDYGGLSTKKVLADDKPPLDSLLKTNVFDQDGQPTVNKKELFADAPRKDHPPLPPRDPGNGRFRPRVSTEDDSLADNEPEPDNGDYAEAPYIITEKQFARGKENYEQESGKYYVIDETVMDPMGEVIENDVLGEDNLELFPEEEGDDAPVIYIRNDKLKMDYQITLVTESLTAVTGFTDDGDPHSQYL